MSYGDTVKLVEVEMLTRMRLGRSLCVAGVMLTLGGATLGILGPTTYALSVGPGTTVSIANYDYSTIGQQCDEYRNGYHFTLSGLEYPEGAVIDAADFGPVNISFSDGSGAMATFTDLEGGSTAHFINTTTNQSGNFLIVSAKMTFPAGTNITGFDQFRISSPPCDTTGVPPTAEGPTTTAAETTATAVASEFPVPPLATTTTTIAPHVASEAPTPPAALPATGSHSAGAAALLGLFLVTAGLVVSGLSRRPRSLES
jgi:LPXTG-motif cell wall-anchored protein